MEKMIYVNHDDVMKLSDYNFIDVYFKCLIQFYAYYKEKLLGLSYSYVLSNGEKINFTFTEECCMHLLGMNYSNVKTFLESYSDYLNLDLIDLSSKSSSELLDIIIEKKDLIMKLCMRAKLIQKRMENLPERRYSVDVLNEFITDFRNCLSDYSMEKFEAIYVLGENIENDFFKQFVVVNPKWKNVDYAIIFADRERVFALGTVVDDYDGIRVSSIRNYKKFDSNISSCFDGCDVCIIRSGVCTKNGENVKLSTNYNNYDFIMSTINSIKSILKDVNYNLDVSSSYSSIISQLNFLLGEYGFYLPEAKQFFSCISAGDYYEESSFHGEVNSPIYSKFNNLVKNNKEMWILIQKLLKEISELKGQLYSSKTNNVSLNDELSLTSNKSISKRVIIPKSKLVKLDSIKMKLLANGIKNPSDKRVSTRGLENYNISEIYGVLGSLSSDEFDLLFKSYVGRWNGDSYSSIPRRELSNECKCDFSYTKRVIIENLKDNISYLNNLVKDVYELYNKMNCLNDREKLIICLKYGMIDSKCHSLEEINKEFIKRKISPVTSFEFTQILNNIVKHERQLSKK